jgi:hypothetical protein
MKLMIWIVGTFHRQLEDGTVAWTYEGAFSREDLAVARAHRLGRPEVFIAPTELDIDLPGDGRNWPGVRYPNQPAEGA